MPAQVVIVPILKKNTDTEAVLAAADALAEAAKAAGLRAKVDGGTEKTPGFKFSYWEMKACAHPLNFVSLLCCIHFLHQVDDLQVKCPAWRRGE